MMQLIDNLLNNAVNYSYDGGWVEVRCGPGGPGMACLAIRDHGIGIPADKLQAIFEDFTQVDSSSTRVYGGTGLGLSIVQQYVNLHDGRVRVQSEEGQGATFIVELPLNKL